MAEGVTFTGTVVRLVRFAAPEPLHDVYVVGDEPEKHYELPKDGDDGWTVIPTRSRHKKAR